MITKSYDINIYKKIGERVDSLSSPFSSNYFIDSTKQYDILYSDIYYKHTSKVFYEKDTTSVLELSTNTLGILLSNIKNNSDTYLYYYIDNVEILEDYFEPVGEDFLLVGTTLYHNNPLQTIVVNGIEYLSKPVIDLDLHVFVNYDNVSITRNKDNFKILINKANSGVYKYKFKSKYLFNLAKMNNVLALSENIYTPLNTCSIEAVSEYCLKDIFSISKLKYPVFSLDIVGESDVHTYSTIRSNLIFNFPFDVYIYIDLNNKLNPILVSVNQQDTMELLAVIKPYFETKEAVLNPYFKNTNYILDYNSFRYSLDNGPVEDNLFFDNKFKCTDIKLNLNDVVTNRKLYVGIKLYKTIYHQNIAVTNNNYDVEINTEHDYDILDEILQSYPYPNDNFKYYTYKTIEEETDG